MSLERSPATRSSVVRLWRRLTQVEKGAALLRRKRESLVAELLKRARPAVDRRRAIDERAQAAFRALLEAEAAGGRLELLPLAWPARELLVDLETVEVWGLHAIELTRPPAVSRDLGARALVPHGSDFAAVETAKQTERLVELLLEQAPKELAMRRLGQALARASRLVNTLEQRVAVDVRAELSTVRRTLDEREREEHLRLKRLIAKRRR